MSLTAEQHAAIVGHFRWATNRLAEFTEAAGSTRLDSVASLLRHHRQLWDHQHPESVLLGSIDRVVPASAELGRAFDALDPAADDAPAVVTEVLKKFDDELDQVATRCGILADSALLRTIVEVRRDGEHVRSRLGAPTIASTTNGEVVAAIRASRIVAVPADAEA